MVNEWEAWLRSIESIGDRVDRMIAESASERIHVARPPTRPRDASEWRWRYSLGYACSHGCGRIAHVAVERWRSDDGEARGRDTKPDGWICTGDTYGTIVCPKCQARA